MTAVLGIALVVGSAAVIEDIQRRQISNWTSGSALAGGLICHALENGWRGGVLALAGSAAGLGVFLLFYVLGGMGGGDLKLMAGFGSLLGPGSILVAAWITAVAGAVLVGAYLGIRHLRRRANTKGSSRVAADAIPYAPAIVIGAWLVLLARV